MGKPIPGLAMKCGSCGRSNEAKVNVNGLVYYYCGWATDQGRPCNHHQKWGRDGSDKILGRAAVSLAPDPAPEPANINAKPAEPEKSKNDDWGFV
jgi:hypothetical protein